MRFPGCAPLLDEVETQMESGCISRAMQTLVDGLRRTRNTLDAPAWQAYGEQARAHTVGRWIFQDPLTRRALEKPRGYAGDAVVLDYLYGLPTSHSALEQASESGREINRHVCSLDAAEAVRFRRAHIARLIDGASAVTSGIRVLSIAAGHLREADLSTALATGRVDEFVALDHDASSLREVESRYGSIGVETLLGSVPDILRRRMAFEPFDFVYSAGVFDYLRDSTAQALAARMFELVRPGGHMLIPNFSPAMQGRGYLEAFMGWNLIYRDVSQMSLLLERIPQAEIQTSQIYSDPTGSIAYLLVRKPVL